MTANKYFFKQISPCCTLEIGLLFFCMLFTNELSAQKKPIEILLPKGSTLSTVTLSFSPDNKQIISSASQNNVIIWDVNSGFPYKEINQNEKNRVITSSVYQKSKNLILSISNNMHNNRSGDLVTLWNDSNSKIIQEFSGHNGTIFNAKLSSDGRNLISSSFDGTIRLWNVSNGKEIKKLATDLMLPMVDISEKDEVAFCSENSFSVIDTNGIYKYPEIKKAHNKKINTIFYSPDGNKIVTASDDSCVKIWNVQNGKEIDSLATSNSVGYAIFNNSGNSIIYSIRYVNELYIWNFLNPLEKPRLIYKSGKISDGQPFAFSISSDDKFLAVGDENTIILIDLNSFTIIQRFRSGYFTNLFVSSITPDNRDILGRSGKNLVRWNLSNLNFSVPVGFEEDIYNAVYYENKVLVRLKNGLIQLIDLSTRKTLRTFWTGQQKIDDNKGPDINLEPGDMGFSKDGTYVWIQYDYHYINPDIHSSGYTEFYKTYTGANDHFYLRIININSAVEHDFSNCKCFSSATSLVLKKSSDNNYYVINGTTNDTIRNYGVCPMSFNKSLTCAPGGRYFLSTTSDYSIVYCDLLNLCKYEAGPKGIMTCVNKFIKEFYGHHDYIREVQFLPDTNMIISMSDDQQVLLWDIRSEHPEGLAIEGINYFDEIIFFKDGKYALIESGFDNTVKLVDGQNFREIARFILFEDNQWFILLPDNYYACTKDASQLVGFRADSEIYTFDQFDIQYNRPDIVLKRMPFADTIMLSFYYNAYKTRLGKLKINEGSFTKNWHVPAISIRNQDAINKKISTSQSYVWLDIIGTDDKSKLDRINVWVNDVPVYGKNGINLRNRNLSAFSDSIKINLSKGKNKIQVSAVNVLEAESYKQTINIFCDKDLKRKPDLYLITIGVDTFKENPQKHNLKYAVADGDSLVNLYKIQNELYETKHVFQLKNKIVTSANISLLKDTLMKTRVDDHVLIFISGHGLLDKKYNYYFATSSVSFNNPEKGGLTYEQFENILDSIPARNKILLIDACHSGELDTTEILATTRRKIKYGKKDFKGNGETEIIPKVGLQNSFELMNVLFSDLRRSAGAMVISSAGGVESAYEGKKWENSVFMRSFLVGLRERKADLDNNKKITISELEQYLASEVSKQTIGGQTPTMRSRNLENDFRIW